MQLLSKTIGNTVIRRINFPKALAGKVTRGQSLNAKGRPLLSEHDEADTRQTCALVLLRLGLPRETELAVRTAETIATLCPLFARSACERASYQTASRTLGLTRWKAVFRASRKALRIDRQVREDATDFASAPEIDVAIEHPEMSQERRMKLARRLRYAHVLLHAAFGADTSRKRRSTFRTHLRTLHAFAGIWAGGFAKHPLCEGNSEDALNVVLYRFRAYLDKGETALTESALAGVAKGAQVRELRAFAQIPENFATVD